MITRHTLYQYGVFDKEPAKEDPKVTSFACPKCGVTTHGTHPQQDHVCEVKPEPAVKDHTPPHMKCHSCENTLHDFREMQVGFCGECLRKAKAGAVPMPVEAIRRLVFPDHANPLRHVDACDIIKDWLSTLPKQ
jgi:hypothetical protein